MFFVAQNLAEILSERESIAQVMQVSELPSDKNNKKRQKAYMRNTESWRFFLPGQSHCQHREVEAHLCIFFFYLFQFHFCVSEYPSR